MSEGGRRDRVLALVRELSADGRRELAPGMRLSEIGIDSLAWAELGAAVEGELGVDLSGLDVDPDSPLEDVLLAVSNGTTAVRIAAGRRPRALQATADLLGGWALRWWFDLRVDGAQHVPATGPAVLAMNHESALDIPMIVTACPRRITFMAKRELFKNRLVTWALRELGGFPVDRGRFDLRAIDVALEAIGRGLVVGMYPEGTRSPGRLEPFLPGAAWLAVKTGAPLVPCSISGTEQAGRATRPGRVRVRVRFREPVHVAVEPEPAARRRVAEELTDRLRRDLGTALGRAAAGRT